MPGDCPDDAALAAFVHAPRANPAVAAHVSSCDACRLLVEELARAGALSRTGTVADPLSATAPPTQPSPDVSGVGERYGRYVVQRELGRGGMGAVFAALDPDLDRVVAVKVLHAEPDSASQARLLREARAMAKVVHTNVVVVHDVGTLDDGRVFIAMEHVVGRTLRDEIADPKVSLDAIVRMFLAAGEGLAAAHAAGVVHRDFKPANVLVASDGRVKVTDFGLASIDRAALDATAAPLTRPGAVMGTPAYMSPEQIEGSFADARSDQFSFAVAFWEAVTGERPFGSGAMAEVAAAVLQGRLRPVPADAPIPMRMHAALVRALSTDPSARFGSMRALLAELDGARSELDTLARDPREHAATAPLARPLAPHTALTPAAVPRPAPGLPTPPHASSGAPGASTSGPSGAQAPAAWSPQAPWPAPQAPAAHTSRFGPLEWAAAAVGVTITVIALGFGITKAVREANGPAATASAPTHSEQPAARAGASACVPSKPHADAFDAMRRRLTTEADPALAGRAVAFVRAAEETSRLRLQSACESSRGERAVVEGRTRCLHVARASALAAVDLVARRPVVAPNETLSRLGRLGRGDECMYTDSVAVVFAAGSDAELAEVGALRAAALLGEDVTARAGAFAERATGAPKTGLRALALFEAGRASGQDALLAKAEAASDGAPAMRRAARALRAHVAGTRPDDAVYAGRDGVSDDLALTTVDAALAGRASERALTWLSTRSNTVGMSPFAEATVAGLKPMMPPTAETARAEIDEIKRLAETTDRAFGEAHPVALMVTASLAEAERREGATVAALARVAVRARYADAALARLDKTACSRGPRAGLALDAARDREAFEAARARLYAVATALGGPISGVTALAAIADRCPPAAAEVHGDLEYLARVATDRPEIGARAKALANRAGR